MTLQTIIESVRMRFPEASPGWIINRTDLIQKEMLGSTGSVPAETTISDTTKVSISFDTDLATTTTSIVAVAAYDGTGTAIPTAFRYVVDGIGRTITLYDSAGKPLDVWPSDVQEVKVRYLKKPTTLTPVTATTTVPDLPEQFHAIFEEKILEIMYSEMQNAIAAGMHRTRAKEIELEFRRWRNTLGDSSSWQFTPSILDGD